MGTTARVEQGWSKGSPNLNAEGVYQFQPRVAVPPTLGPNGYFGNAESIGKWRLPRERFQRSNPSRPVTPGLYQPWAQTRKRLRRSD